jgi:beta-alanine degradation protein BauB
MERGTAHRIFLETHRLPQKRHAVAFHVGKRSAMAFKCTIPAVPTVQRDDENIRITRWDFEPGASIGWHRHAWPYFVVMLTESVMRIHDGANVNEIRLAKGEAYDRLAGVEHDVMNGSDTPMSFVEIEMKKTG